MSEAIPFNIPMIDLCDETERHVIVAQGTPESYKGHPHDAPDAGPENHVLRLSVRARWTFRGSPTQR